MNGNGAALKGSLERARERHGATDADAPPHRRRELGECREIKNSGAPYGNRTRVTAVRGRRPDR